MLCMVGVVNAKVEQVHATFENPSNTNTTWNGETKTFTWSTTYYNQLRNIGLPSGDLTKYKKLVVDCTINSGEQFRILFYKGGSNLTLYAKDGVNEFILKDALEAVAPNDYNEYLLACDEICLSGNNGAAPGEAIINDVYLETYNDEGEKVFATFENPSNTNTTWNGETKTFTWSTTYYNQLRNIGLPSGDISKYKKLVVDCTINSGEQFRILFYKGGSNLTLYAKDGVNEFILKEALEAVAPNDYNEYLLACDEICLSGNNGAAPGEAIINSVYLETYPENESVEIPEITYEEDPGKPAGDFVDLTEAFPSLQPKIGLGADEHPIVLGNGEVVVGARSQNVIADLSEYSKLTIVATPGLKLVLYMNHEVEAQQNAPDYKEEDAGKYVFMDVQAGEDGLCEVDLTQFDKQDLNAICLPWDNSNKGTVWYLLLSKGEAAPVAQGVIFDFNASNHATSSNNDNAGDITADETLTQDGVTMVVTPSEKGTPNRYWSTAKGPQLRMYGGKMTIEAPEGKAITKIDIKNGKWNVNNVINGDTLATGEWAGNSTNAIMNVAGNTQMDSVVVTLADKNEETTTYKEPVKPLFADGKYYINNVGTKLYLAAGADWGTHGVVKEQGLDYDLLFNAEDGTYTMNSQVSNGGTSYYVNGSAADGPWNDGAAFGWTFTKISEGVYSISSGEKFLTAGEDGKVGFAADASAEAAQWTLTSAADVLAAQTAAMEAATAENPVDVTFLIKGADFNRNDLRNSAWKATKSGGNQTIAGPSENRTTYGCESWNNTFEVSQTLENIPEGVYEFSIAGYGTNETTKIFANETEATFVNTTGAANFKAALDAIGSGEYTGNTTGKVNVISNTLKIGVKRTEQVGQDWAVFDKAKLTYYGPVSADAYKEVYDNAMAAAKAAQADEAYAAVTGAEKAALDKTITDYTTVEETVDAYKAAALALNAATEAFTGAKADYEALPAAKEAFKDFDFTPYPYASEAKIAAAQATLTAEATSGADAKAKAEAIAKAFRTAVESNAMLENTFGAVDFSDAVAGANADKKEGWTGNIGTNTNEGYTDGNGVKSTLYLDGGWSGSAGANIDITREVVLPAGKYILTATARGAVNLTEYTMSIGGQTVELPHIGAGANDGVFGMGWNDAYVEFESTGDTLTLEIKAISEATQQWMSINRFRIAQFPVASEDVAEKTVPEGWESLVINGNLAGDDVSCFFSKEAPASDPYASAITPLAGKDNSRGIVVKSINSGGQVWDSQFFIQANKSINAGTKLHMEFDYKATAAAKVSMQFHTTPGAWVNNWENVNATTEWQHFEKDFDASADFQTIAFNLNELKDEATYFFDNIVIWAEKAPEIDWVDVAVNGNMEGDYAENFYVKIYPSETPVEATFTAGAGKDGSQGLKIESPAKVSQAWDTQFWIVLPMSLEQGTKFRVEFDYKADAAANSDVQYHALPGDYAANWTSLGFTTEWQHFEKQGVASGLSQGNQPFQSVAFNLSFDTANNFYFDNVKIFLDKNIVPTGIQTVNADASFIEGAVYDLQGRRVAKPARGLYIVNGKKVMVK